MAPLPSLALAKLIVRAYRDDDFLLVIIHGPLRMGKSAYALKVMGQVYDYLKGRPLSTELVKDYVGFQPLEVIHRWLRIKGRRIPAYLWDDAGVFLSTMDWWTPALKGVQKYMNVIGTDMNCLILTTPDPRWILRKMLHMPGTLRGKVMKTQSATHSDCHSVKYSRKCRGYKPYLMPDLVKSGVNVIWEDNFSCYIPDDVYAYYQPLRMGYAEYTKQNIIDQFLPAQADDIHKSKSMEEAIKDLGNLAKK